MNPSSQPAQPVAPATPQPAPPDSSASGPQLIQDIPVRHSVEPAPQPAQRANPISAAVSSLDQAKAESEDKTPASKQPPRPAAVQHVSHKSKLALIVFTAVSTAILLSFLAFLVFRQG